MKPKNYGKDISSITTPIRFHLPDGSSQSFKTSAEALSWFNQNYGNGYSMVEHIPTQGDSEHPILLQEVTVTAPAPKQNSTSTRKGVDMFIGANYSPSFNKHFYGTSDFDALFGKSRVEGVRKAWLRNPQAMLNWTEGGNAAAAFVTAPFAAYAAGEYALPWLAENVAPYLSARGWLGATQAAGNTPAWLTPTSATAIDATLAGSATGASINDMRENGPTVGNVLGTALGVGGLAYEAAPTIMEGYTAARNAVRPAIVGMKMRTMPLGEVETPTLTPQMRYKLGDVEINDPNLNYRQGARGTADDFLKSGKVRVKYEGADAAKREKKPGRFLLTKSFNNPMFKQGGLWYDSWVMDEPGAVPGMPDLLVTRQPLRFATKGAGPAKADLGGRRIPFSEDQLSLENTSAYSWENGYGFRRRTPGMPKTKYPFSERPSTLTDAERAGIPRGERNNNPSPDYTLNILSMFPEHDASYIHTGVRTPDTKPFAEYLLSVGVDALRLSDSELQLLMRMRLQSITHPSGEHGIMDTSPWSNYVLMFNDSRNTGDLEFIINRRNNTLGVSRIHKEENVPGGFSRKAYDIGIDYAGRNGMKGVVSGDFLHSPEQTYRVWEHYPTRLTVGNTGHHTFNAGRDVNKVGGEYSIDNGPIVLLPEPSASVLPYKHLSFFHPAMIENGTLQAPKWNVNSPFFSKGGKLKNEKH